MAVVEPVSVEIPVAWGDMDAFAHVNNTTYLRWFETARIAFFERVQIPHHNVVPDQAPILAKTSCTFERPLTYPDTVRTTASIGRIGGKSFTMLYHVFSLRHDVRAAHGDGVVVWYDYGAACSVAIPDGLRARLRDYLET